MKVITWGNSYHVLVILEGREWGNQALRLIPCLRAVSEIPRYNAPKPSSLTTVYNACAALRYLGTSRGSAIEWFCAWRRILMTSMGVTTATASVTPAARPARIKSSALRQLLELQPLLRGYTRNARIIPKKVAFVLTAPVSLFASMDLYASNDVKRMAILGIIPVTTAPRPL